MLQASLWSGLLWFLHLLTSQGVASVFVPMLRNKNGEGGWASNFVKQSRSLVTRLCFRTNRNPSCKINLNNYPLPPQLCGRVTSFGIVIERLNLKLKQTKPSLDNLMQQALELQKCQLGTLCHALQVKSQSVWVVIRLTWKLINKHITQNQTIEYKQNPQATLMALLASLAPQHANM